MQVTRRMDRENGDTPFSALTPRGRVRRLRAVALLALQQYDLDVAGLSVLTAHWNTVFRVDISDGHRYVLRISRLGHRTFADLRSEIWWLQALCRDTDLAVPRPIPARDGSTILIIEGPGVPEARHCVLFGWVEGRHVGTRLPASTMRGIGTALALLHEHADSFVPPVGFTRSRMDTVWGFGTPGPIYSDVPDDILTRERRALVRKAADEVQKTIDVLHSDPAPIRFLHADLNTRNIKTRGGRVLVLDFDNSCWGHPIQDLGIALYHLNVQHPQHRAEAQDLLEAGYRDVRTWPEEWSDMIDHAVDACLLGLLSEYFQSWDPGNRARVQEVMEFVESMLGSRYAH
ncbi:MAG TPA: phosphotransferase [Chloroflexota bacterium]